MKKKMNWWRELKRRIRFLGGREVFDQEMDDEIRFHLETRVGELRSLGVSAQDARGQAQREFGPKLRVHEDTRRAWQFHWLEDLFSDLNYAIRALRRNPGFALAAVLSLALGIGANTTIFSLTMEFLFSHPSCREPDSLKYLLLGGNSHSDVQEYRYLRDSGVFNGVAGLNEETEANWRHGDQNDRVWGANVTDNFFDLVGIPVVLGHPIRVGEGLQAVLSNAFWKGRLGADRGVIGRKLVLDGQLYTVSGVLPADHRTLTGFGLSPDLYVTFSEPHFPLAIYARLPQGMSPAEAYSRTQELCTQLDHLYPKVDFKRVQGLETRSLSGWDRLRSASSLPIVAFFGMLMAMVGLVLLIACANVASLLLARAAAREHELAIRRAIGAGRGRIVRQLLAESFLLAALGTAAGFIVNLAATSFVNGIRLPLPVPLRLHVQPDWRLLGYSIIVAMVSAMLCGLVPALRAAKRNVSNDLKLEERQIGLGRLVLQRVLVGSQIAVSVLLLTVGFLFLKNLLLATTMSPGFDVHHTTWAYMRLVPERYFSAETINPVVRAGLEKLRSLPGVDSAATLEVVPMNDNRHIQIDLQIDGSSDKQVVAWRSDAVGPDYFKTMSIPIMAGREFMPSDRKGNPEVAILNENLARRLFGQTNPVGHTLRIHNGGPITIVGVAKNSKYFTMGEENVSAMYLSFFQSENAAVNLNFMVRGSRPPASLLKEINVALSSLDPTAAIEVKPMEKAIGLAILPSQVGGVLLGSMGLLALLLAAVGLYGVLIYSVSRRLREFGVRMALGAATISIVKIVLRDSAVMLCAGVVAGVTLAAFATPLLALFLVPEIHPHDLTAFAAALTVLAAVAVAANISPTLRAIRVDPGVALRYE